MAVSLWAALGRPPASLPSSLTGWAGADCTIRVAGEVAAWRGDPVRASGLGKGSV